MCGVPSHINSAHQIRGHNRCTGKVPDSVFMLPVEYPIRTVNRIPTLRDDGNRNTGKARADECAKVFSYTDGLTGKRRKKDGTARVLTVGCVEVE